jgi:hypothetical protein
MGLSLKLRILSYKCDYKKTNNREDILRIKVSGNFVFNNERVKLIVKECCSTISPYGGL